MATPLELAEASKASYDINPKLAGWNQIVSFGQAYSGFSAVLFKKGAEHILAFRGTDGGSDIDDDAQLALGIMPVQYRHAAESLKISIEKYRVASNKLYVTGHSLGGGLAALVSAKHSTPLPVATFNAPGMNRAIRNTGVPFSIFTPGSSSLKNYKKNFNKILHIRTQHDIVSLGTGRRIAGNLKTIKHDSCKKLNAWGLIPIIGAKQVAQRAICAHSIELLVNLLKTYPEMKEDLGWV